MRCQVQRPYRCRHLSSINAFKEATVKLKGMAFALSGMVSLLGVNLSAQHKRAITPRDCVTVRDLLHDDISWRSTIRISPDGGRVAYPARSPNLATNANEVELYVRKLPADPINSGKPVRVGDISALQWLEDGRHLTFLMKENGRRMIEWIDALTGAHEVLVKASTDIAEYSIDQGGSTLVYGTDVADHDLEPGPTAQETARGYRIPFRTPSEMWWPLQRNLFVTRRRQGRWTTPEPIVIRSPLTRQSLPTLPHLGNTGLELSLSPNGKQLLLTYVDFADNMPDEWRKSGYMQLRNGAGVLQAFVLLVLYDLTTGETTVPLKTPFALSSALWASDSKSFVVSSAPQVGSALETEELKDRTLGHSAGARLFWVEPATGTVEQVTASRSAYPWEGALSWTTDEDLLVRTAAMTTITRFSHRTGEWREGSSFAIPRTVGSQVATNGTYVLAEFNDVVTPPELFLYRPGQQDVQVFARLNSQFDELTLARPQEVHWTTSTGFKASGLLLLPPDYVKGVNYPLVIHTKPFGDFFTCSFGDFPSFAPQPLANAGIMYLGPIATKGSMQREEDYYPKGYPGYQGSGGVAEAAFSMDLWEGAVRALAAQGLIDSSKVGIIGFSRTGWYTEFILAHSKFRYRAATVADNVQYSLGEYWLSRDANMLAEYDHVYGGPPYGATLKNWLEYSLSFNLDKIRTPLLMEQMGNGSAFDRPNDPPIYLATAFEVFTGLNRLNRPVELYYYPNEEHTPEHPQARLASLQRNLDWYRFWLQDYERPNPEDPDQYVRWHKLRELQQEDARK